MFLRRKIKNVSAWETRKAPPN